jgi:quinol monooxygenase YgiN
MVVEYIRYRIEADRVEAFQSAYGQAQASLQQAPQCVGYELARCTEEPGQFVLRIGWTSEEDHLQGFRKGPQFQPFLRAIQPFVKNIEEMRHYAPTPIQWSRR